MLGIETEIVGREGAASVEARSAHMKKNQVAGKRWGVEGRIGKADASHTSKLSWRREVGRAAVSGRPGFLGT
jgi:hypothetical protein